jgi:hypothetical protein
MASSPLFSDQEIQQVAGGQPSTTTPQPQPSGSLFSDQEIQAAGGQPPSGQVTNDVGNTVIVPKDGESFADTMKRAAAYGKTVTQDQINKEMATAPKKAATVLAAAPAIGFGGAASLAIPGEIADVAMKHLAGNVLPGLEYEAAKQTLLNVIPKAIQFADTMGKLGIGAGGLGYLLKTVMGEGSKK